MLSTVVMNIFKHVVSSTVSVFVITLIVNALHCQKNYNVTGTLIF